MLQFSAIRLTRSAFCMLLLALSVPSSGCIAAALTAGVVGAGAAGYAVWQAGVPKEYPVNLDQAWSVAQQAVTELGMTIDTAKRDNDGAVIESHTGDGTKVQVTLEPRTSKIPADGQWTRITVKVGTLGDGQVSERVLNQIDVHLAPPVAANGPLVPVAQPIAHVPVPPTGPPPLAK